MRHGHFVDESKLSHRRFAIGEFGTILTGAYPDRITCDIAAAGCFIRFRGYFDRAAVAVSEAQHRIKHDRCAVFVVPAVERVDVQQPVIEFFRIDLEGSAALAPGSAPEAPLNQHGTVLSGQPRCRTGSSAAAALLPVDGQEVFPVIGFDQSSGDAVFRGGLVSIRQGLGVFLNGKQVNFLA